MTDHTDRTLLLVEDKAITAMAERKTLEKRGFKVVVAHTGEQAVDIVRDNPSVDLVLMDIDLGRGITGDQAAQQILEIRHLPIVFLTSHSEQEYVERVKRITRYGYVLKNSGEFVLWDAIDVAFELFEAHQRAHEREERYRALFYNSHSPMMLLRPGSGEIVAVNPAACRLYGWTSDELTGMRIQEINQLSEHEVLAEMQRAREEQQDFFVFRHRVADGTIKTVEVRSSPISVEGEELLYSIISDVTDRVHAEEAVKRSERKYRDLFESAPVGIFRSTMSGRLIALNRVLAEMLGCSSPDEAVAYYGDLKNQVYARPAERDRLLRRLGDDGHVNDFEFEAKTRDGDHRWFILNGRLVDGSADDQRTIEGFIVDVTDRKRELVEYETVFDGTQDAMFLVRVSEDGQFRYVRNNHSHEELTGVALEDVKGRTPREVLGNELARHVRQHYQECVEAAQPITYEETLTLPGGRRTWRTTLTPIIAHGRVVEIVGSSQDITERTEFESRLEEYAAWLELTMSAANMAWWKMDVATGYVEFDATKAEMLGRPADDFAHYEDFTRLLHPDDYERTMQAMRDHLSGQADRYDVEYRIRKQDGGYIWLRDVGAVVEWDSSGRPASVAGIVIDVSEQKEYEEQREALLSQKDVLLREVHHRIKNNMHTMMSLLLLAEESLEEPAAIAALSDARSRLQSMEVLYDKLYRTGEYRTMPLDEYLVPLAQGIHAMFPTSCAVRLTTDIASILMDVKSLSAVGIIVTELITNAMKHAFRHEEGGSIHISAIRLDGRAELTVHDSGVGGAKREMVGDGDGFGLSLVKALVDQLEGSVEVDETSGTRFVVSFPLPDHE